MDETKITNLVKTLLKEYLSPLKKFKNPCSSFQVFFDEYKAQKNQLLVDIKTIKAENESLKTQIKTLEFKKNEKRKNMVGIPKFGKQENGPILMKMMKMI